MSNKVLRIGTRESQLAVWQANLVKKLLKANGIDAELVFIKSEGDIDLQTPLYEMGVQGIFTRSLDMALLNDTIDIAVHSMKDVPTQLPEGLAQAAAIKRASYKDLLVFKGERQQMEEALSIGNGQLAINTNQQFTIHHSQLTIATSSIRRKAQWLNRYPNHSVVNLRGNVNTRLRKVDESDWSGAIFAAAGLERIGLRPENSIELDWMLPAPAQGAIMAMARFDDGFSMSACDFFNDADTELCTRIERDFLRTLLGGCSTPISALAEINEEQLIFRGNIFSTDGRQKVEVEKTVALQDATGIGKFAALEILENGGKEIADSIRNETK